MSSSDAGMAAQLCLVVVKLMGTSDSKIDLLDPADVVTKKIRKAVCEPKKVEGNGVLAFTEFVLLPAAALRGKREFTVERRDAEPLVYTKIEEMREDFINDIVRFHGFD